MSKTYNVHLSTDSKERHLPNLTEEQFNVLMRTWSTKNNATPPLIVKDDFGRSIIESIIIENGHLIFLRAEEAQQDEPTVTGQKGSAFTLPGREKIVTK